MTTPSVHDLLPHRAPNLRVHRVVSWGEGRLVAEGDFQVESYTGHFPGRPVVPGVDMVEGLAQALGCLARLSNVEGSPFLAGVDRARFRGLATPPCTLTFEVEVTDQRMGLTYAKGKVREGARLLCTAKLSAAMLPQDLP